MPASQQPTGRCAPRHKAGKGAGKQLDSGPAAPATDKPVAAPVKDGTNQDHHPSLSWLVLFVLKPEGLWRACYHGEMVCEDQLTREARLHIRNLQLSEGVVWVRFWKLLRAQLENAEGALGQAALQHLIPRDSSRPSGFRCFGRMLQIIQDLFPHLYTTIVTAADAAIKSFELGCALPEQWWLHPTPVALADVDEEEDQPSVEESVQWVMQELGKEKDSQLVKGQEGVLLLLAAYAQKNMEHISELVHEARSGLVKAYASLYRAHAAYG